MPAMAAKSATPRSFRVWAVNRASHCTHGRLPPQGTFRARTSDVRIFFNV